MSKKHYKVASIRAVRLYRSVLKEFMATSGKEVTKTVEKKYYCPDCGVYLSKWARHDSSCNYPYGRV